MIKYIVYWTIWINMNAFNTQEIDVWGHRSQPLKMRNAEVEYHLKEFDTKQEADSFYKVALKRDDIQNVRLDSAIYGTKKMK